MKSYVLGFAFDSERRNVLLIKKNKPAWQQNKYNGLGGKIEKGETAEAAISREFYEETCGIKIPHEKWELFAYLSKPEEWFVSVFRTFDLTFNDAINYVIFRKHSIDVEHIHVFPLKEIPFDECIPNLKWLIPLALDNELTFKYSQMLATHTGKWEDMRDSLDG